MVFNLSGVSAGVVLIQSAMPSAILCCLVASMYCKVIIDNISLYYCFNYNVIIYYPNYIILCFKIFLLSSILYSMKAIILSASAWMILPVMDAFAKFLSSSLDVLQITWGRFFFTVVFTFLLMIIFYRKSLIWTNKPLLQIIRGLFLVFSTYLFFYSISVISLPKALTLAFVAPLFVTALSPFFLKEKVGIRRWTAVFIGFIGTLIVIRPGFLEYNLATFATLGTGFCYGFYLIITRKLSTSDNPLLTLLFTGVVGVILSFFMPSVWINQHNQ